MRRLASAVATAVTATMALSACSVYDIPLPGGADVGDDPITVTAKFRDVLDLVPQSTVKINDVTVGKVTEIELSGYTAEVTLALPKDTNLPDNVRAEIRQTSLLGEKFVSLDPPSEPSSEKLSTGDVIGLANTGRNPEIEEVLGALGALLSGGGVGQLKLIMEELNTAFDGREDEVRSVISQIRYFTGQLDQNKTQIVGAIENLNRLAVRLRQHDGAIKSALDNLPAALASIDRQREDLVKLLGALDRLSNVGVRVIKASKESTINSLRDLAPILNQFAAAGDDLPRSLQVFLTYPFVDEAVGRDPQVARNLHMGDYTNLSIRLDLDLRSGNLPTLPGLPEDVTKDCNDAKAELKRGANQLINQIPGLTEAQRDQARRDAHQRIDILDCDALSTLNLTQLVESVLTGLLGDSVPIPDLPDLSGLSLLGGSTSSGGGGLLGGLGLGRAGLGSAYRAVPADPLNLEANGYDPGLGTLLLQGMLGSSEGGTR